MNKYFSKFIAIFLILVCIIFAQQNSAVITETAQINSKSLSSKPTIFDLLFSEAKQYYVEALVANHHKDSAEVKFAINHTLENVAEISELDSLTKLQKNDYNRFCEKLNYDFRHQFSYINGDSGSYNIASIREELETYIDTISVGRDDLIVVEDKPGHIPVVKSKQIEKIISYFQDRAHNNFQKRLNNAGRYKEIVMPILKKHNVPPEVFYLPIIESGYKYNAYSYAHASGMWQFIASTGARYGLDRNWWVDQRRDPIESTRAAAKHLRDLYNYFNDWYLALAAYNCGKLNVLRAIRRERTRDYWQLKTLPKETRRYIPKLMAAIIISKDAEQYGFTPIQEDTWKYDTIKINRSYNLETIARKTSITSELLKEYNPELRRWSTPPNIEDYTLRVPQGKGKEVGKVIQNLPKKKQKFVFHVVKRGDNLNSIAHQYNVSLSAILAANNINNSYLIHPGERLKIPQNKYNYAKKSGQTLTHIVRKGESLYEIADRYDVYVSKLRAWNNLYGSRYIYPGQKLKIYGSGSVKKNSKNKLVHVVKKGETLSEIADSYNVGLSKIRQWNDIKGRYIRPGQKIYIYKKG